MYYKKLVGKRVYLSPADIDNEVKFMTKWLNEDEDLIYQNGFYRSLLGEGKVKEMLEKWNEGPYMFSIINENDEFMGHVSLFNTNGRSLTLGIYLADEFRSKGYGSEAMRLVCDYVFDELGYENIHLEVFSYNTGAIKFYKRAGFKICGVWHNERYAHGRLHDVIMMEYLKQDHLALKEL